MTKKDGKRFSHRIEKISTKILYNKEMAETNQKEPAAPEITLMGRTEIVITFRSADAVGDCFLVRSCGYWRVNFALLILRQE